MCISHHHLWRHRCTTGLERLTMNTRFLKRVRAMFATYDAPPEVIRSYQRQWVRSVRRLGNNWLVAKPIERIEQ
jgi:hypothetical protein